MGVSKPHNHIRLTNGFREDVKMWPIFWTGMGQVCFSTLSGHKFKSTNRRFSLLDGRRASIFCESMIMPINSIMRLGPSVLCSAIGTPNVQNVNNMLERLSLACLRRQPSLGRWFYDEKIV